MLMGQYEHSIDPKNRINFPAKFREQLGENFILTVGLDECIAVYSAEEWDKLEQKINQLPMSRGRSVKRYFFSNAVTVEPALPTTRKFGMWNAGRATLAT